MSEGAFAIDKVEYYGHFISGSVVETDPQKIAAVVKWPIPKNVKELRSSLGLAVYYRKLSRNYAKPLTNLLEKDGFKWSEEAIELSQSWYFLIPPRSLKLKVTLQMWGLMLFWCREVSFSIFSKA